MCSLFDIIIALYEKIVYYVYYVYLIDIIALIHNKESSKCFLPEFNQLFTFKSDVGSKTSDHKGKGQLWCSIEMCQASVLAPEGAQSGTGSL